MRPSGPGAGAVLREWWVDARLGLLPPGDATAVLGGSAAVVVGLGALWTVAASVAPAVWAPTLVVLTATVVSVPVCRRVARGDRRLLGVLLLGLALKLAFVAPRLYVNEGLYSGEADAGRYHGGGEVVAANVRDQGQWTLTGSSLDGFPDETRSIGFIVGGLYLAVGPSQVAGALAFAWLSWCGVLLAFRAFQIAYPGAPGHLPAVLMFFLPSLLYWPASIGKDAVMVLGLGGLTLALAHMLTATRPLRGLLLLVPSAALTLQVRPHLTMIVLVSAAASLLARRTGAGSTRVSIATRILLLAALAPLLVLGLGRMDAMFGDDGEGGGTADFDIATALEQTSSRTAVGGSVLSTRPITSPADLPVAVVSVLYRPFPFEVRNVPMAISSLEGVLLLVATATAGRWLWRIGPAVVGHPFAAFCAAYLLCFVFAFSNIANAGILARQRVQLFPILILLVAAAHEHGRSDRAPEVAAPDPEPSRPPGPAASSPHPDHTC